MYPNNPEKINEDLKDEKIRSEQENNGSNEQNQEKYRPIELEQNLQKSISAPTTPTPTDPNITNAQNNNQIDPVQQVKSMISAGYTPSLDLIQHASDLVDMNSSDSSNVWFAVLLQKLIREYKK